MTIEIPDPALVMLIGPSGSGKTTLARRHFRSTEVLSSDFCRGLICDNEADQSATDDAFELLFLILKRRLARRRTTVIDATNVQFPARAKVLHLARDYNVKLVAVVFQLSIEVCRIRNEKRTYRQVPGDVIDRQFADLASSAASIEAEGFDLVFRIDETSGTNGVTVSRRSDYS